MENLKEQIVRLVELMGFSKFQAEADSQAKLLSINIEDSAITAQRLPVLVLNLNRVARLIAKKQGALPVIVDINNYRKERDRLIVELARAAARRATATKEPVHLPAMNAYERRLIHAELSIRPDVTTESTGEGKSRYVIVKSIDTY